MLNIRLKFGEQLSSYTKNNFPKQGYFEKILAALFKRLAQLQIKTVQKIINSRQRTKIYAL